jgi:hypothetical protein
MIGRVLAWALAVYPLSAQVAPKVSPTVLGAGERLAALERIYREQSRLKHLPLLRERLRQLGAMDQSGITDEIRAEAAWLSKCINEGGVVDLVALAKVLSSDMNWPSVASASAVLPLSWDLTPQVALELAPKPAGSSVPASVLVKSASWRLESLPAGEYELIANYATLAANAKFTVQCQVGGATLERPMSASDATSSPRHYRLLSLGVLRLGGEVSGASVRLSVDPEAGTPSQLILRHLVLRRRGP